MCGKCIIDSIILTFKGILFSTGHYLAVEVIDGFGIRAIYFPHFKWCGENPFLENDICTDVLILVPVYNSDNNLVAINGCGYIKIGYILLFCFTFSQTAVSSPFVS